MTDKEILKKAIEKTYKNGWGKGVDDRKLAWTIAHDMNVRYYRYWYSIIFSHSFAKAFWGEGDTGGDDCKSCGYNGCYKVWKYHLSKMVLEPKPLQYLRRFL